MPVHHLRSHIAANYITHPDLEPPFLALVVSGGHSHIIEVRDYTDFHIIGRTRDDAAGEAMDKAARAMGLDYPGGVNLDRVSKDGDPKSYKLRVRMLTEANMISAFPDSRLLPSILSTTQSKRARR